MSSSGNPALLRHVSLFLKYRIPDNNMYQAFKSLYSFLCWTNHSSMLCALLCFVEIQTKKEQLQPENTRQLIPEYTRKKEVILCSLENKSSLSISAAAVCLSAVLKNRTLGLQSSRYYPI